MFVTLDVSRFSGWLNADASLNIFSMVVTPEVSQLEMSALKLPRSKKSSLMSVMPETFQLSMEPYVSSASPTLVLYKSTAVSSSALVIIGVTAKRRWLVGEGVARNTGSHCGGGTATGWLVCASLLATLGLVMCGGKAKVRKAAATPMRTSTRKPEAFCFACMLTRRGLSRACFSLMIIGVENSLGDLAGKTCSATVGASSATALFLLAFWSVCARS